MKAVREGPPFLFLGFPEKFFSAKLKRGAQHFPWKETGKARAARRGGLSAR
jgi:hypothetical protein